MGVETDFTLIAPVFSPTKVITEDVEINESDEIEDSRRKMIMLDYYYEAAQAAKKRAEEESCTEK